MTNLFPVRSKGSRFTLGVCGLRVCSFDVAFTFATVRNRLQPFARLLCGRTHGKFCRRGHFWMFQTSRCFVSRGRRGTLWHSNLFDNVSRVSNSAEVSHEMLVLLRPRVSSRVSGFPVASPCLWGKLQKPLLFEGFQAGCHVALRGRRSTLWHSNLFDNVSKMSKLEGVSHEMFIFLRPRVSSRVSGFPVASPRLWGKLHTPHSTRHTRQLTL